MSRPIPPPIGESELEKLASKLPETLIPNFQLVSKLMVDTFVSPDGPALMLTSHYYFTGRKLMETEPVSFDPIDQLYWCIEHLPYFSAMAKTIKKLRNKLAHKQYVSSLDLKKISREIIVLKDRGSRGGCLVDSLMDRIKQIIMVAIELSREENVCGTCGRPFERQEDPTEFPIVEPIEKEDKLAIGEMILLSDMQNDPIGRSALKGRKIKLLAGKFSNRNAVFRSWSGTVCTVDIEEIGRTNIRKDTPVLLL